MAYCLDGIIYALMEGKKMNDKTSDEEIEFIKTTHRNIGKFVTELLATAEVDGDALAIAIILRCAADNVQEIVKGRVNMSGEAFDYLFFNIVSKFTSDLKGAGISDLKASAIMNFKGSEIIN